MDDLLAEFVAETRDMLAALSGEVVAWEANPHECLCAGGLRRFGQRFHIRFTRVASHLNTLEKQLQVEEEPGPASTLAEALVLV